VLEEEANAGKSEFRTSNINKMHIVIHHFFARHELISSGDFQSSVDAFKEWQLKA
jgi:hypothetical protein